MLSAISFRLRIWKISLILISDQVTVQHVAGTVGGTGAPSGGKYEGVAPGADLVGYGSGAAILIRDALGGFDYALTHQHTFKHPIRIINNLWGTDGTFDPNDPVNIASYMAFKMALQ